MRGAILLGVDGGGTRCRVRARYADGTPIGEASGGTANIFAGVDAALANIIAVSTAALEGGGLSASDLALSHAGLGLAGANVSSFAADLAARPMPFASYALETDAVVACRGAHGGHDGAIAILGTGSAYVLRRGSAFTLLGGWGIAVSDQGSGADLGRSALSFALLALDGVVEETALCHDILSQFDRDPGALAEFARDALPRDFGRFAPLVWERFDAGDAIALRIVGQGVASVEPMLRRLMQLGAPAIALLGGLAARYRPLFPADIQGHVVSPVGDAMDGALDLAETLLPAGASA
ncbi:N-acetylglucosamine kinase [Aureimonas sp. OT7]|uniref:BadF/BadG/BcrA/BcrD ATPase family protein n=1 Tax=Aureimonas sp. OT7 TaxID=2816454 RepID=UPI001785176D|nr:BadF/BadG/BcrA/BcrD ATPase family protein [Aureimonas sp. OT7]QOG05358.1 N-acetylglucosamine kinase [Aureimonas sp. OT7]